MKKKLIVFGFGARGKTYASYAARYPEEFELTAIIENSEERCRQAEQLYSCPIYSDYKKLLMDKLPADIVAVATQDIDHEEHAIACMKAGYDLLLEKPIANTIEGCLAICEAAKQYKRKVMVCHVLRYTSFYRRIKDIIDEGTLGEIITIQASENVGYYHQAHSFVRGPWRSKKESSPMILAKCCHDMDIIRWLINKPCLSVASMGSLRHFRSDMAPTGAAEYCSECELKNCVYRAQDIYLSQRGFSSYFTSDVWNDKQMLQDLKKSRYDKCVYKSNNDVVDHQVTIMQFEDEVTATHTMTAFSKQIYRDIKIYGTKAELVGTMEKNYIEIRPFRGDMQTISWDNDVDFGGHGGGDKGMMHEVYRTLNGEKTKGITFLDISVESHLMAFAAEESRVSGGERRKVNFQIDF